MSKFKKIGILLGAALIVVGIVFVVIGFFKPKGAGLLIQSDPASVVFVNGEQVGRTPYNGIFDPEEVVVKLVPESFDAPLAPYERKIKLVSGVETVITREFAETETDSGGALISFEKIAGNETSIAVLSEPDAAQVKLNGLIRGFTPYKTTEVAEGEYSLTVSAPGYLDTTLDIVAYEGHVLTVVVKLIPSGEPVPQEEQELEKEEKKITKIEILSTPTNFLRVRAEASTSSEEVGQVTPGEQFDILEEQEEWYKIAYEEGEEGWISGTYAKKVEVSADDDPEDLISPTPTTQ